MISKDPGYAKSKQFQAYERDPLGTYSRDLGAVLTYAKMHFPKAKLYLVGHSEGAQIALRVTLGGAAGTSAAPAAKAVRGIAIIGFSPEAVNVMIHEQLVYRPLGVFERLDTNHDQKLSLKEVEGESDEAKSLKAQFGALDLNQDGHIDRQEFMAGSYTQQIRAPQLRNLPYSHRELDEPAIPALLATTTVPVLFLQGEWDSQTPVYYTQSMQMMNALEWHNQKLKFKFFRRAGHILDPHDSPEEIIYRKPTLETLLRVADELKALTQP